MESIAVSDVDGDDREDVLLLSFGPTSGMFTFSVTCITNQGDFKSMYWTEYYKLGFYSMDGKLVVEGVGYDSVHHYFDIRFVERNGEKVLQLYEGSKSLWER